MMLWTASDLGFCSFFVVPLIGVNVIVIILKLIFGWSAWNDHWLDLCWYYTY